MSLSRTRHVYSSTSWPLAGCRNLLWCALSPLLVNVHLHCAHAPWPFNKAVGWCSSAFARSVASYAVYHILYLCACHILIITKAVTS